MLNFYNRDKHKQNLAFPHYPYEVDHQYQNRLLAFLLLPLLYQHPCNGI